jgi:hypothetical protein
MKQEGSAVKGLLIALTVCAPVWALMLWWLFGN